MHEELHKNLPPRFEVDHKIELDPWSNPPVFSPYRIASLELEDLRKQLKKLPDVGHIRLLKAPFVTPVLF